MQKEEQLKGQLNDQLRVQAKVQLEVQIPEQVNGILETLQGAGHEAYVVGGCVRDALLGREPHDWDITTSALPLEVKTLFPRTIDTGLQHGTVTVMCGRTGYEVTTFRVDGVYEDGRHPKEVTFTPSLEEDLKRRDFTINAMAYDGKGGLIDLFDGQRDLEKGIVRAVGDPMQRFSEDALRIMRAVRFSAQLGYEIDGATLEAASVLAPNLKKISAERIRDELEKTLMSDRPDFLRTAWKAGITRQFLPEFDACMETEQINPHHCYTVGEHTLKAVSLARKDKVLRLTMLLHDFGKPACRTTDDKGVDHFYKHGEVGYGMAQAILKRLKYDNATIRQVVPLVQWHDGARRAQGDRQDRRGPVPASSGSEAGGPAGAKYIPEGGKTAKTRYAQIDLRADHRAGRLSWLQDPCRKRFGSHRSGGKTGERAGRYFGTDAGRSAQ